MRQWHLLYLGNQYYTTSEIKVVSIIHHINTSVKCWCKIYHPFITLNCGDIITVWFSRNFTVHISIIYFSHKIPPLGFRCSYS